MDRIIRTYKSVTIRNQLKYSQLSSVDKKIYDDIMNLCFTEGMLIPDILESSIKKYNVPYNILERDGKYAVETETFRIPEMGYLNAKAQYLTTTVRKDTPPYYEKSKQRKIAVLIIATNKYVKFLFPLIESMQKYLLTKGGLPNYDKKYFIFTNNTNDSCFYELGKICQYVPLYIDHYPFPFPTLFRFYYFQKYYKEIENFDQVIYIDTDAIFSDEVGEEVLHPRCAVQHCGYFGERGTYETNPKSKFYVPETEGVQYFGGGFWSFNKLEFLKLITYATENLTIDLQNHIIPVWHDESILNRYLIDNPPDMILSPSYHYPEPPNEGYVEKWKKHNCTFEPKIIMLNKSHQEIRETEMPGISDIPAISDNKLTAIILFHSNIRNIYQDKWIDECLISLQNQTFKNFKVFEFCYGNNPEKIWKFSSDQIRHEYYHVPLPNHVYAENSCIEIAYNNNYDYFFIVNLDDIYDIDRIVKQLAVLNRGYDLVSSDFVRFSQNGDTIELKMSGLNLGEEISKNHNIIAHPVVAFNRNFWEKCRYFDVNGIPEEDFSVWKKAHAKGLKINIIPEVLLRQRVHDNNVSKNK